MINEYYYLISSLILLDFKEAAPISYEEYIDNCRDWLSQKQISQLILAKLDIKEIDLALVQNNVIWKWIIFENSLRNELVRIRAGEYKISPENYLNVDIETDPVINGQVRDIIKEPSPLKKEINLLQLRWQFLDNLLVGHQFDIDFLIIYSIKLQILDRMQLFNKEAGKNIFDTLYKGSLHE